MDGLLYPNMDGLLTTHYYQAGYLQGTRVPAFLLTLRSASFAFLDDPALTLKPIGILALFLFRAVRISRAFFVDPA